jgi:hypothetical protein
LTSFGRANEPIGEGKTLRERLRTILRNYQSMNAKTRKELIAIGFDISDDGNRLPR